MYKLIFFLGVCTAFALGSKLPTNAKEKIIGCYFASWAEYRKSEGKFTIDNIDSSLCTHIFYAFAGLGSDASVRVLDPVLDIKNNGFKRFNNLRKKNPELKTLISMGGWNEGSENYTKVVSDPILREKLVNNVVDFVKKYDFNGLDLDWEYPAQRGGVPSDKENFVLLLKALREKLEKEGLILSVAIGASEKIAKKSYDIKGISKYVNFINLMTYDFNSVPDVKGKIRANTPLYPSSKETADQSKLNIDYVVKYWLAQGAPSEKIILGTAFYGKSYTLASPKQIGKAARVSGPGEKGKYTDEPGSLGYNEICDLLKNENWKLLYYDYQQQVPYAYKGTQIVTYDNVQSITKKAEYVKTMNLGGAFLWSIDMDDFNGTCGEKFPLLKTLNRILRNKN